LKPPPIALQSVLALQPPSLRTTVPATWADSNGHMNMRWYVALFDDAGDELHERCGLTPEFHRAHRSGTVDLEHHTHFLHEVMPGDTVAVYARLVERSAKRLHYLMFLVNEGAPAEGPLCANGKTPGRLAAIFECMNAFLDLEVRRTAPFPQETAAKIDAWLERDRKLDWPPPVSGAMQA
jgi:acyl-CoA thioester hydrolase